MHCKVLLLFLLLSLLSNNFLKENGIRKPVSFCVKNTNKFLSTKIWKHEGPQENIIVFAHVFAFFNNNNVFVHVLTPQNKLSLLKTIPLRALIFTHAEPKEGKQDLF
jgi:hypothetical protein